MSAARAAGKKAPSTLKATAPSIVVMAVKPSMRLGMRSK